MRINYFLFSLLLTIGVFPLNSTARSTGNGNGGIAIVCRDSNQEITSAKLLDLE